jgi:hypothetical protein
VGVWDDRRRQRSTPTSSSRRADGNASADLVEQAWWEGGDDDFHDDDTDSVGRSSKRRRGRVDAAPPPPPAPPSPTTPGIAGGKQTTVRRRRTIGGRLSPARRRHHKSRLPKSREDANRALRPRELIDSGVSPGRKIRKRKTGGYRFFGGGSRSSSSSAYAGVSAVEEDLVEQDESLRAIRARSIWYGRGVRPAAARKGLLDEKMAFCWLVPHRKDCLSRGHQITLGRRDCQFRMRDFT